MFSINKKWLNCYLKNAFVGATAYTSTLERSKCCTVQCTVQCTYCGPSCLVSNAIRNIAVNEGSRKNTQLFSSKLHSKRFIFVAPLLPPRWGRLNVLCTAYCILGWCDLALLQFSKSYTFLLIRFIFKRSIASHARQSFPFQKIAGTFEYFFFNLQKPSLYIKEQSPIRKFEIKSFLIVKNSQKWSKRFLIYTGGNQTVFWFLFSFLLLNKLKNKFCFRCNL